MINRLHIYSRGQLPRLKPSVSAGNVSLFSEDSVVTKLDNKLKEFANRKKNLSSENGNKDNSVSSEAIYDVRRKIEMPPIIAVTSTNGKPTDEILAYLFQIFF